jgi:hypothetical protein
MNGKATFIPTFTRPVFKKKGIFLCRINKRRSLANRVQEPVQCLRLGNNRRSVSLVTAAALRVGLFFLRVRV